LFPESEDFENQEIETVTNEKIVELEIIEPNLPIRQEEDNSEIGNENIVDNNKNYCPTCGSENVIGASICILCGFSFNSK
jgi:formate dehydrogenase maturation protein FdhE